MSDYCKTSRGLMSHGLFRNCTVGFNCDSCIAWRPIFLYLSIFTLCPSFLWTSDVIAFSKWNKPPSQISAPRIKWAWINKAPKRALIEDLRYVISQTNVTDMYNLTKIRLYVIKSMENVYSQRAPSYSGVLINRFRAISGKCIWSLTGKNYWRLFIGI